MKNVVDHIPVFLINLDRAPHRLARMDEKLSSLGIAYERFAAIDGRTLPAGSVEIVAPVESWLGKGRPVVGEVGNFLSHRHLLELIVERGHERACIIEDDVDFDPCFPVFLDAKLLWPTGTDVLKLEIAFPEPRVRVMTLGKFGECELVFVVQGGEPGCAAYIITQEGARKLLPQLRQMTDIFDWQAFSYTRSGLSIAHILPLPVWQELATEMERSKSKQRKRKTRSKRIWHSIRKRWSLLRKRVQEIRFCLHSHGLKNTVTLIVSPSWRATR
ncbi:hypothetical protein T281_07730 [Rhodomicrobium udaipurense JA643]|uniref:Glycosyltransferase family 25 protein n=1 Tax=Rhodomicrobium udaipurense TaxID=1202716 RepID=A0A8I1KJX2_9HYPH|nr:glycosyltransferase family 25 protein [Rhodomicrobium udaipurense]KAI95051.1 hypothetical protein T281_07730 [Rhodomicrobium udaipurense JA643]MBJ7544302.1 glycosyltransferase family 25 protein [Rhodomicrobium udaipurense]